MDWYNNLENYKQQQAYNTFYQIWKEFWKILQCRLKLQMKLLITFNADETFDNTPIIYEEDNIKYNNPTKYNPIT